MRRLLPALLGATLLLGACGDDDDGERSAVTSIPDDTTTSSTTTEPRTVAPDVIPQDESQITEEYVEAVLNALYEVSLEAIQHTRGAGVVDEVTITLIESIFTDAQSRVALNGLIDLSNGAFAGYRDDPSPATANVAEVIDKGPDCIFGEVRFDTAGLIKDPPVIPEGVRGFVRLLPATDQQTSAGANPTAWVIDALPVTQDGTVPAETCPAP